MTSLADVELRLRGARGDGHGGRMAMCPVHEAEGGHNPSLHVWEEDGKVCWHCFAGCDHAAVGEALGIERSNGFDPRWTPRGPSVAEYRYVDEDGRHLFTVCRTVDKQFPCWRPDPASKTGKAWKLGDVRRVLYHLPQVVWAVDRGEPVYVVEGEKDADALRAAGVTATCNPHGAGKWRPEYSRFLTGADVVIVADKDDPGRDHARSVAAALRGAARNVRVVEAAEGKDTTNHLGTGHSIEEFVPWDGVEAEPESDGTAAAATPGRMFIDWSTFWDAEDDEQEWAWREVLAKGRGHAIYAMHKGGKSLLSLYMAADMATKGGMSCLYLDYEMTKNDVRERLRDMKYGPDWDMSHLYYALLPTLPALDTEEGGIALAELVDKIAERDPDRHVVVIIDTISRAVWGEENSADTWRFFYIHTGLRLKQRGVTWLRLDHGGKDVAKGQRGSSGKGDDVDVVWKLTPTENGVRLQRELSRMNWVPESVTMLMEDLPLRYLTAVRDWAAGTHHCVAVMERLGLPVAITVRAAAEQVRAVEKFGTKVITDAVRWRKEEAAEQFKPHGEHGQEHVFQDGPGTSTGTSVQQESFSLGNGDGNSLEQDARVRGEQSPPIYRGTVPHPSAVSDDDNLDGFPF